LGKFKEYIKEADKPYISNVFPLTKFRDVYDQEGNHLGINPHKHIESHGEIRNVPVESIVTRQPILDPEYLKQKKKGYPLAVHQDGKHYLIDGNHKAARKKDDTHIKMKVIDGSVK